MDIGSITSTITGLKTVGDLINGILNAKTSDAVNAAVREINRDGPQNSDSVVRWRATH